MSPKVTRVDGAHPMTIPVPELALNFYFEIDAYAEPAVVARMLAETAGAIRRYLDDPVSAQTVGAEIDPRHNVFLAMLLAIDRTGYAPGSLSVMPQEQACRPAEHRGAARCPFCVVLHAVAEAGRAGLLRVRAVAGDKDAKGRYYQATDLAVEPGPALDGLRERIKRLSLPPLLSAAAKPRKTDTAMFRRGAATGALSGVVAGSWKELSFQVGERGFQVGGVAGRPGDLGLDRELWGLFRELARAGGQLRPASLGGVDAALAARAERLSAALRRAFPQVPGEPVHSSGTGGFEAEFGVHADEVLGGG